MTKVQKNDLLELEILKHVENSPILTNRSLAEKLGVSVKLAHALLSGMVERGLFHIKKHHSRRWDYFLTPSGISEKAKLTREFITFSMQFYREARQASSQVCRDIKESGLQKVAFIGAGDLAEIVYLGVKEWNLELVAVYTDHQAEFLGQKCHTLSEIEEFSGDSLIVCLYDKKNPMAKNYLPSEIKKTNNMYWIFS
jgi:DNA-binding MarR family transcriptional regulator